jgi:hypothetical protein
MGRIVTLRLGKLEKKALLKYISDSIRGLDNEKEKINPREYEAARKVLRHTLKKIRKTAPKEDCGLEQTEYDFLKTSLAKIVEHNKTAFNHMFFLKRWFYRLLSKNYEHLYNVVKNRGA